MHINTSKISNGKRPRALRDVSGRLQPGVVAEGAGDEGEPSKQRKFGKPQFMCFRSLLYAVFHSIRIGFEGSKLKIVDQKASDGRASQSGFQFLRWL